MNKPKPSSQKASDLVISNSGSSMLLQGEAQTPLTFIFVSQDLEAPPRACFFLPLAEYSNPFAKAIYIEQKSDTGPIQFSLGLLKTSAIETWSAIVPLNRRWNRLLWVKCGLPKGTRAHYKAQMEREGLDFISCKPTAWIEITEEERVFLSIGLFWAHWKTRDIPPKIRPDYLAAAGVKAMVSSYLANLCKWAGFIPLSPKQQLAVDELLKDPQGLFDQMNREFLGEEDAARIKVAVTGVSPIMRDYATETVMNRKLKFTDQTADAARALLGG